MKVCKWQMTKETIDTGKQSELIIFNSLRESSFFGAGISCAFSSCSCPRWRLEDGWGSLCDLRSQIPPASHRPPLSSSQNFQTLQWFLLDRSLWHEEPQPVLLVLSRCRSHTTFISAQLFLELYVFQGWTMLPRDSWPGWCAIWHTAAAFHNHKTATFITS